MRGVPVVDAELVGDVADGVVDGAVDGVGDLVEVVQDGVLGAVGFVEEGLAQARGVELCGWLVGGVCREETRARTVMRW
jgi:hypothetical protein